MGESRSKGRNWGSFVALLLSGLTPVTYADWSGLFQPECQQAIAALSLSTPQTEVLIHARLTQKSPTEITCTTHCDGIDWNLYKGKKIRVVKPTSVTVQGHTFEIAPSPSVDQVVLDTNSLTPQVKRVTDSLRQESIRRNVEVGIWIVVTEDGRVVRSKTATSDGPSDIAPLPMMLSFNEMAEKLAVGGIVPNMKSISFFHTHPTSDPISAKDQRDLEMLAKKFPMATVQVAAVCNTDPSLLFLASRVPR
jgi:hypothetical protein